jgi:hypothetical protein
MENQSTANRQNFEQSTRSTVEQNLNPKNRIGFFWPVTITFFVSAIVFGVGGFYVGKQSSLFKQDEKTIKTEVAVPTVSPTSSLVPTTAAISEKDQIDPVEVARKYLDAYVSGDWVTAKSLSGDNTFDENVANGYGFTKYEILDSSPGENNYYHIYVRFTDNLGNMYDKAPHSNSPLEVLMHKNNDGNWQALTWYFFE